MAKNHKRALISTVFAAQTTIFCTAFTGYLLREYDGKIALFRDSDPYPLAVYDTPEGLYPADEELLREGIRLKSEGEITRLIEDLDLE